MGRDRSLVGGVAMFRIFDTFLLGICILCVNILVVVVGTITGWLPAILQWLGRLIRQFFTLSYEAYSHLFTWLAPIIQEVFRLDIYQIWIRLFASVLISPCIVGVVVLLLDWRYPIWLVVLAVLHGLVVGLRWDSLDETSPFRLGVDI